MTYESDGWQLFRQSTQEEFRRIMLGMEMNHLSLSDAWHRPGRNTYLTARARKWASKIERETVFQFLTPPWLIIMQDNTNGIIEPVSGQDVEWLLEMLRSIKVKFHIKSAFVRPQGIEVCPGLARETYFRCSLKDSAHDQSPSILPLGDVDVAGLILDIEGDDLGMVDMPQVRVYFLADDYVLLSLPIEGLTFRCQGIEGVVECFKIVRG